jgi:hypothetical protein
MVLVLSYFELNPDCDPAELGEVGMTLMQKGLYPAEGVKSLGWWLTADYWGVSLIEADNEEAVMRQVNIWRVAKPGVFKAYRSSLAMETKDAIPVALDLKGKLLG